MIHMIGGWLVVEQFDKTEKDKARNLGENPFLNVLSINSNFGKIVHIDGKPAKCPKSGILQVGTQVYFGNAFEKIIMDGREVLVMKEENVFATVTE